MTDNEYNELIKEIEFEKKWLIEEKRMSVLRFGSGDLQKE